MEFRKSDPGAVQYGNFKNYYQFNDAQKRIQLLPRDLWMLANQPPLSRPYLVLDVGCNAGDLTQLIYKFLTECLGVEVHMLGIDIDSDLVQRAKESNAYTANVSYAHLDVMNVEAFRNHTVRYLQKYDRCNFDACCCFSITMWIHLNHGDEGLERFLHILSNLTDLLVVEPQPWKCYQTAARRMKRVGDEFPLFKQLQWRTNVEEHIQDVLETMMGRKKIFECPPTCWQRRICFYR